MGGRTGEKSFPPRRTRSRALIRSGRSLPRLDGDWTRRGASRTTSCAGSRSNSAAVVLAVITHVIIGDGAAIALAQITQIIVGDRAAIVLAEIAQVIVRNGAAIVLAGVAGVIVG